jgi:Fe-S cluster biogenesis protein NfuA
LFGFRVSATDDPDDEDLDADADEDHAAQHGGLSGEPCAEALADALIRPTLNRDNGDIVIHGIKDGVMELSFTGHCAGCPYAANTLQNVIMRTFLRYMPQIKEIRQTEAK